MNILTEFHLYQTEHLLNKYKDQLDDKESEEWHKLESKRVQLT